jgi:hypothetical protein
VRTPNPTDIRTEEEDIMKSKQKINKTKKL